MLLTVFSRMTAYKLDELTVDTTVLNLVRKASAPFRSLSLPFLSHPNTPASLAYALQTSLRERVDGGREGEGEVLMIGGWEGEAGRRV